jgi:hypothetical protein
VSGVRTLKFDKGGVKAGPKQQYEPAYPIDYLRFNDVPNVTFDPTVVHFAWQRGGRALRTARTQKRRPTMIISRQRRRAVALFEGQDPS